MAQYTFAIELEGNALKGFKQLEGSADSLGRKVNEVSSHVKNNMGGAFSHIAGIVGGMAAGFGVFEGVKSILKLGSDAQQTAVSFEVMLGSVSKAKELTADLNKFSAATPFTSVEVNEGAKALLNYNISQKDVINNLRMLGDAAGGNGEKFKTMVDVFGKVSSKGRLQADDLNRMTDAGFNPLNEMVKKTGRTYQDLMKDMEKGKISVGMLVNAFKSATGEGGKYYGMMDKQSRTVAGLWSTFMDKLEQTAIKTFYKIEPYLTKILNALINNFDKVIAVVKVLWNIIRPVLKVLKEFGEWFIGSSKSAEAFRLIIMGIAAAFAIYNAAVFLAGVRTAFMASVTGMSTIGIIANTLATEGLAGAWVAVNIAMAANPIGMMALAIAGVIVGLVLVADQVRNIINMLTNSKSIKMKVENLENLKDKEAATKRFYDKALEKGSQEDIERTRKKYSDAIAKRRYAENEINQMKGEYNPLNILGRIKSDLGFGDKKENPLVTSAKAKAEAEAKVKAEKQLNGGAVTQSALNTSALGGANGGLGEAKNIKIDFHKALMEVNVPGGNGTDIVAKAPLSVEMMLRVINNLSMSQGATM